MELVVQKGPLLRELQLFQGIVERKTTIPVLANVLLEAEGAAVRLLATDLEVALESRCDAAVAKPGAVTVPAKKLYEIVRALPDTELRIEEPAKGSVKLTAERFDSRMQTLPREDFPALPEVPDEGAALLSRAALKEMVTKTQFAITGEDTRYFLNGALFVLRRDAMSMVATDGHRLALVTVPREPAQGERLEGEETRAIWPRKTLHELTRLLAESQDDVRYQWGDNHLFYQVGGRVLISRKIEGQFPAYERVIPKHNDKRIEFDSERLASAIRRVALLSNERSRAVKFSVGRGAVEISSSNPDLGEARETLPADYAGPTAEICFNAQYLLDFLGVVETDAVTLEFRDEVSQALMRPVGAAGYDYLYVIMPMRI
jgi:DNA polymerase-3 subunit beta